MRASPYTPPASITSIITTFNCIYSESFPVLLVANKVDLLHSRKISEEKGKEIANQLGVEYIETSAKEPPLNIDTAFHQVS